MIANRGTRRSPSFHQYTAANSHIIPVDTTLPGANQAQNRIAIHLHGGEVPWISDGGPFDWWTPDGTSGLSFLNGPGSILDNIPGNKCWQARRTITIRMIRAPGSCGTMTMPTASPASMPMQALRSGYLIIDPAQDALLTNGLPPLGSTLPLSFRTRYLLILQR